MHYYAQLTVKYKMFVQSVKADILAVYRTINHRHLWAKQPQLAFLLQHTAQMNDSFMNKCWAQKQAYTEEHMP